MSCLEEEKPTYLNRCIKWLDEEFYLTKESLEAVIEQFGNQLHSIGNSKPLVKTDLEETLILLNEKLKELIGSQPVEEGIQASKAGTARPQLVDVQVRESAGYSFDPGPLTPVDLGPPLILTKDEKDLRLAGLLQHSAISLGAKNLTKRKARMPDRA